MEKNLRIIKILPLLCTVIAVLFLFSSCVSSKTVAYFPNIGNATITHSSVEVESVIQKSDLLSIYVTSPNPDATAVFNNSNLPVITSSTGNGSTSQSIGYLVDNDGNILFPFLGTIQVAGLTKKQLAQKISTALVEAKQLKDPIVTVRFLNYRVTVLGEVNRPTVVTVANEKISLLEALGLAGDLTIYGKRDNVLVIREEGGKTITKRVNLNSEELFNSSYYYLKTNDVVYVEPNKTKIASVSRFQQLLPVIFSGLSLLVIIAQYLTLQNN
ncbi:MAG: polysaccharide biosynthesis/export family protein [Williamsia sp.]|nr:polysaccharide biosynthesis/export family protein [Williamsia sp.]